MSKNPQPHQAPNSDRSVVRIIVPEFRSDDVVTSANSLEIPPNQAFCFHFPQFRKIYYFHLELEKTESKLEDFVREIVTNYRKDLPIEIDSEKQGFIFKNLRTKEIITSQSKLKFDQFSKVIVFSQTDIPKVQPTSSTFLVLWLKIDQNCVVDYEQYKDFQLREVLISNQIDSNQFVGLLVAQQILRLYQCLSDLHLQSGSHQAYLLLPYQIFYHDMYHAYSLLQKLNFDFLAVTQRFGDCQIDSLSMKRRYQTLKSANLSKVIHLTIIYLTSTFFHPKMQKKYINRHLNGKVFVRNEIDLKDQETQQMSMMINCIESLPTVDNDAIFLVEEANLQKENFIIGEIVRIETFAAATNSQEKLSLKEESYYYLYEIEHLTAKNISLFNGQHNGLTHLILPYTDYLVIKVEKDKERGKIIRIVMREMPLPRAFHSNLIFWISKSNERPRLSQDKQQQPPNEIVLIRDNMMFETWLWKYSSITAMRKCCLVWNCTDEEESLETLWLGTLYFGKDVHLIINNPYPKQFMEKIKQRQSVGPNVKVTSKLVNIQKYVASCFNSKKVVPQQDCECQKCQLY